MTEGATPNKEDRVLVLAPTARDGGTTQSILGAAGIDCLVCTDLDSLCLEIPRGAAAAVIAAEAILQDNHCLAEVLRTQPRWSDFPLIVLTAPGIDSPGAIKTLQEIGPMTFMKRPVQVSVLISTVQAAVRDRRRQYEVRSHHAEERRQADALADAEENLRRMVESVQDYAIFAIRPDGKVATWNVGAARVFGWEEAEIVGQPGAVLFVPEDRDAGIPAYELEQARTTGRSADERWHIRKDGSRFFASGVATPMYDKMGELHGYTKVCRDVTDRREAEEALRDQDRSKDEFLAMLAHELRNPLAPIRNTLQIMRLAGVDARAVFDQSRAMLERQVNHIVRLIDDLLDVSRVSRGKIDLRLERVDLTVALNSALETTKPAFEAARHELTISLPNVPIFVEGDTTRLAQVLANVLNNAAKYTEPGGRVGVTVERHGAEAIVRIKDSGVGVPADMLSKVFDLFIQVDRTLERSQGGLGIGLTLAKRLVEMHGGSIDMKSAGRGKGSEVTIKLPALSDRFDPQKVLSPIPTANNPNQAPCRILVVDDNHDAAKSLTTMLEMLGHNAQAVFDGPAALQAVEAIHPEIVLLDIGMPGMDGFEVATRLRARHDLAKLRIVAVTGFGSDTDRQRTREAGFDHHFIKPVASTDLQRYLDRLQLDK